MITSKMFKYSEIFHSQKGRLEVILLQIISKLKWLKTCIVIFLRNVLMTDYLYRFYKIGNKTLQNYTFLFIFWKKLNLAPNGVYVMKKSQFLH